MKNKAAELKKPKMKVSDPYWDYHEIIHYLEKKHSFDSRNLLGRRYSGLPDDPEHLDFWHWLLDNDASEIHNGDFFCLDLDYRLKHKNTPVWVKEILQFIKDEFAPDDDCLEMKVEW